MLKMITKSKFYGLMPEIIEQLYVDGWLKDTHAYWKPSNNFYSDGSMGYALAVNYRYHRYNIINGKPVMSSALEQAKTAIMKEEIERHINELFKYHGVYTLHVGVNDSYSIRTPDSLVVRCVHESGRYFQGPVKPSAYMLSKMAMGEGAPSRRQLRMRREANYGSKESKAAEDARLVIERFKNPFERVFG